MKFPSKVRTFKESTIFHALEILELKKSDKVEILKLFEELNNKIDIIEYKDALCLLHLIDKIEIDFMEGIIYYVKNS